MSGELALFGMRPAAVACDCTRSKCCAAHAVPTPLQRAAAPPASRPNRKRAPEIVGEPQGSVWLDRAREQRRQYKKRQRLRQGRISHDVDGRERRQGSSR